LVRRICKDCKKEHEYTPEEMHAFGIDKKVGPFFKGQGCDTCGVRLQGRQGLYEVMALSSRCGAAS